MRRATATVCFTPGKPWLEVFLLLLNDLLSFVLAIGLVSIARYLLLQRYSDNLFDPQVLRTIGYVIAASVITLAARGLYPGWGRTSVVELKQIVGAITLAYVLISVVIFVQGASVRFSRSVFLGSWFFAVFWLPVGRFLVRKLIARFPWWGEPVVIIGQKQEIERVSKLLVGCPRLGLRPVAGLMLDCEAEHLRGNGRLPIVPWSPGVQTEFQRIGIQTDILAISPTHFRSTYPEIAKHVELSFGKTVFLINDEIYGITWAEPVDIAGQPALISHHSLLNPAIRLVKLVTDYLLALIIMPPVLAIGLVVACWIRLDSPGSILYTHERIGQNGKPFRVFKFRTMVQDADKVLSKLLAEDAQVREEWERYHKLAEDVRITRAGRWIRRLSLDELPQFINILRGEMSLIGPRPLIQEEIDMLGDAAPLILRVRPGLTGWWQVMGRNSLSFEDRTRLDIYYVSNWSLWLDLFVFIKTFWVLVFELGGR